MAVTIFHKVTNNKITIINKDNKKEEQKPDDIFKSKIAMRKHARRNVVRK